MNVYLRSTLLLSLLLALACGDGDFAAGQRLAGEDPGHGAGGEGAELALSPRVVPVGLGDVHDTLRIDRLGFDAEIFVLPEGMDAAAASAAIRFDFADGVAHTALRGPAIELSRAGRYQVLVRVLPGDDDRSSVELEGAYVTLEALHKPEDEEPAPLPADGNPTDEPAPLPADEGDEEPAPLPADEGDEEPAPLPADEGDEEPAPLPADEGEGELPSAEPAPLPADGGDDARGKSGGATEEVFVSSTRHFEFYAGVVDVRPGSTELVVTWDVRSWLRALLAGPLGLANETEVEATEPGFGDVETQFNVRAR